MRADQVGSAIERADLRVRQWKEILRTHEKMLPTAALTCKAMLIRAQKYRSTLNDDNTANKIIVYVALREVLKPTVDEIQ